MSDPIYYGSPDPFGSYGERPAPAWGGREARPALPEETPEIPASDRLQELLSRAVEDQVSEQRALLMSLEDIRGALARFETPTQDEMRATVVSATAEATASLSDQVRYLTDRLEEVSRRVDDNAVSTRGALDGLAAGRLGEVADLVDGMAGVRTDLRSLPEQLGPGIVSALSVGLEDVRRQVSQQGDALSVTRSELSRLTARTEILDELSSRTEVLPQLAAAIGALGERMREGLSDVRGTVERSGAAGAVTEELGALRADVSRLATSVADQTLVSGQLGGVVREGVRDAVRDFVRDTLRDAVREVVTVTTRDTERRLAAHVDEAVLMLAQALLRRRSAPSYGGVNLLSAGAEQAHETVLFTPATPAPEATDSAGVEVPVEVPVETPVENPEETADVAEAYEAPGAVNEVVEVVEFVEAVEVAEVAENDDPGGDTTFAVPESAALLADSPLEGAGDPGAGPDHLEGAPFFPASDVAPDTGHDPDGVGAPGSSFVPEADPGSVPVAPSPFALETDFGNDPLGTGEVPHFFDVPAVPDAAETGEQGTDVPGVDTAQGQAPSTGAWPGDTSPVDVTLPPGDVTASLPPLTADPEASSKEILLDSPEDATEANEAPKRGWFRRG